MSNFWSRQLAKSAPPQRPAAPQLPRSGPWWAPPPPPAPVQQEPAQPQQQDDPNQHRVIGVESIRASRYGAVTQAGNCPACDSADYFAPQGSNRKRCFDCGYPIVQTTSGMSGTGGTGSGGGPARPSRQISHMTVTDGSGRVLGQVAASAGAKGQSNFNPQDTQAGRIS